ncbi:MAG: hypothetical protein WCF84_20840 [Anaerolineae bacterium]
MNDWERGSSAAASAGGQRGQRLETLWLKKAGLAKKGGWLFARRSHC